MPFIPPIPLIRRNYIIRKLKKCGAISPETAVTFAEAGLINPTAFEPITRKLVNQGIIRQTPNGKYYI